MLTVILLVLLTLETLALLLLFHHHLVNQNGWHQLLAQELASAKADIAKAHAWIDAHLKHNAAPPASAPTKPA